MKESKLPHTEQPQLFLGMHIAQSQLALGRTDETKAAVEEAKDTLASLSDVSVCQSYEESSDELKNGAVVEPQSAHVWLAHGTQPRRLSCWRGPRPSSNP